MFFSQSLSLVLPIFIAGITLIWVLKKNYLAFLDKPISRRFFGANKTWRGVFVYVVMAVGVCFALFMFNLSIVHPIFLLQPVFVGSIFALSYIAGELLNSLVKRRIGIAAGQQSGGPMQKIIDNIDGMVILACVLIFVFGVSIAHILVALAIGMTLHLLTDGIMKRLGLKK